MNLRTSENNYNLSILNQDLQDIHLSEKTIWDFHYANSIFDLFKNIRKRKEIFITLFNLYKQHNDNFRKISEEIIQKYPEIEGLIFKNNYHNIILCFSKLEEFLQKQADQLNISENLLDQKKREELLNGNKIREDQSEFTTLIFSLIDNINLKQDKNLTLDEQFENEKKILDKIKLENQNLKNQQESINKQNLEKTHISEEEKKEEQKQEIVEKEEVEKKENTIDNNNFNNSFENKENNNPIDEKESLLNSQIIQNNQTIQENVNTIQNNNDISYEKDSNLEIIEEKEQVEETSQEKLEDEINDSYILDEDKENSLIENSNHIQENLDNSELNQIKSNSIESNQGEAKISLDEEKEEIIKKYFAYQDSPEFTDQEKKDLILNSIRSESAKRYAEILLELKHKEELDIYEMLAKKIFTDTLVKLQTYDIEPERFTLSTSWALWDIAKQLYYLKQPHKSSNNYKLADPLYDKDKQQEIIDRHIGWIVYKQMTTGRLDNILNKVKNSIYGKRIIDYMIARPKPGFDSLPSYKLAKLGECVRLGLEE